MVAALGFEPKPRRVRADCANTVKHHTPLRNRSERWELNPRPPVYKTGTCTNISYSRILSLVLTNNMMPLLVLTHAQKDNKKIGKTGLLMTISSWTKS